MFVTWSKTRRPRPALDPGSPAQASLPIEPLPLARSPTGLPKRRPGGSPSLSTRPAWRWKPKLPAKTVRCSAALLGSIPLGVPLCSPPRKASSRVALEKIDSSGASYRLTAPPLRRALASPAGGDRIFGPAASACRCRLLERPGPPSRSLGHHAHAGRVAKAKNKVRSLWITGISGTSVGTLSQSAFHDSARGIAVVVPFPSAYFGASV